MTLNPEDLDVTSFDTTAPTAAGTDTAAIIYPTTDPTAATRCFICPPISHDCY